MKNQNNGRIVFRNTVILEVMGLISDFPRRYHNYYHRYPDGRWKCELLDQTTNTVQLRLVDQIYEPPRGIHVQSESPVFHISLHQESCNVILRYKYKWNKLTFVLGCFYTFVALLMFALGLYMISVEFSKSGYIVPLFLSAFLLVLELVWLIRKKKHDQLTIRVFHELLHKNFNDIE